MGNSQNSFAAHLFFRVSAPGELTEKLRLPELPQLWRLGMSKHGGIQFLHVSMF